MAPHPLQDYHSCMERDHGHPDHSELSETERRVRALETVLTEKGSPGRHNVVVCTLPSCYPWPVLGLPPRSVPGTDCPST